MKISRVKKLALENDDSIISLNVNRFNSAYNFYEKLGFKNVGEEDIELDFGYLMEDYKYIHDEKIKNKFEII